MSTHTRALIASVMITIGAQADEQIHHTTNEVITAQPITVIGSKLAVHDLPASGEYLDSNDIRLHNYDNLNLLARKMPGVYAQEETGNGLLPNISLRGVDTHRSQKITMMEDGVLTAPAAYSAPSAYYAPTLGRMSGLEVMKGSSQIKYGPHTTGGVLNYLSTPVPQENATYLKSSFGTDNDLRIHTYIGNRTTTAAGDVGYVAELYHHQTDGFKTIRKTAQDDGDTGLDKTDYMLKLFWEPKTENYQQLEAKVGYTEFEARETYLGLSEADFNDDPYQRYAASQFDNFQGEHFRTYLKHYVELDADQSLSSMIYYNKYHRNWYKLNDIQNVEGEAAGNINLASALARGGNYLDTLKGQNGGTWRIKANNRDYELYGLQTAYESDFTTGNADHHLEVGARLHVDTVERFQWQDQYQVDSLGNVTNIIQGTKGAAGDRDQKAVALALHLQDELKLGRLTITPGGRYEHIRTEYENRGATTTSGEGSMDVFGLGVNAKFDLSDDAILFGGLYRGYSVPAPADHLSKDMGEETSLGAELGARFQHKSFNAQLIGFYTHIDDMISGGYVGGATDTDGANAGSIDSAGLEFSAQFDAGEHLGWGFKNPYWLSATYTYAVLADDTRITDSGNIFVEGEAGNRVPYIPELQISCGTGIEIGKLKTELSLMFVDETYTTASNTERQENILGEPDARYGMTDAHLIVNGAAFYQTTPQTKLFVNVRNMLNEEYVASRHPYGPRPGAPISLMAGIEASF